VERATILTSLDLRVGLRGFAHGLLFHDRHGAEQLRVEARDAVEVDARDLRGRELALSDQGGEAMGGQERNRLRVVRHGAAPLRHGERRPLERDRSVLAHELLHERASAAGVWLERPRHRFAVAEWRRKWRLGRLCERALGKGASAKPERARRGGHEGQEDELASIHSQDCFGLLSHELGFVLNVVEEFELELVAHCPISHDSHLRQRVVRIRRMTRINRIVPLRSTLRFACSLFNSFGSGTREPTRSRSDPIDPFNPKNPNEPFV
jgi:hypothetical protein